MNHLFLAILYGTFVGAMMPAGAWLARSHIGQPILEREAVRRSVVAFGGGALVAAVALVLVPKGMERIPSLWSIAIFFAGGAAFAGLARSVAGAGSSAQTMAMLTDFVPEAIALGAVMAAKEPAGLVLALLIGAQNLPEGFTAYREMRAKGGESDAIIRNFVKLALLGPALAILGYVILADYPALTGAIMLFAAGGLLFLTFNDIAVEAHVEGRQDPALAAVAGFCLGLLGAVLAG